MSKPEGKKLAVLLTCSDWRLHQAEVNIIGRVQKTYGCETDLLVIPGPDGLVFDPARAQEALTVQGWGKLLATLHGADMLITLVHQDCGGCKATNEEHDAGSVRTVRAWKEATGFKGETIAACADYRSMKDWELREIARA